MGSVRTSPHAESIPFDNSTNGFIADRVQPAIEELIQVIDSKAGYVIACGYGANAGSGRWLEFFEGINSGTVPHVAAEDGIIRAISVAVESATTATFTVYVDGVAVETLTLTSARKAIKNGLLIPFDSLQELSVRVTSGSCKRPLFNISGRKES